MNTERTEITEKLIKRGDIVQQRLDRMMDTEIFETVKKVAHMTGRCAGLYAAVLLADEIKDDEKFKKKMIFIGERLEKLESESIELAAELGYMV